jgi:hypothetical protein
MYLNRAAVADKISFVYRSTKGVLGGCFRRVKYWRPAADSAEARGITVPLA